MTTYETFCERVKTEIYKRGYAVKPWCRENGVSYTSLYRKNQHHSIGSEILVDIADKLGVSTDYLLGRD